MDFVWPFRKMDAHTHRNYLNTLKKCWVSHSIMLLFVKVLTFFSFFVIYFSVRIAGGQLVGEMSDFAIKVQQLESEEKVNQEALADAPDEFLDPIMSTLMTDPVILPSSHVTVDRTTIARHLLSDQSDPFNRSPLTMDQVKPDEDLKAKIDAWILERKNSSNLSQS